MATFDAENFLNFGTPLEASEGLSPIPAETLEIVGSGDGIGGEVAVVSAPFVSAVRSVSASTMEVTFSRNMANNADLVDVSKYALTGGLTVKEVTRLDATRVLVRVSPEMDVDAFYELTVNP